MSVELSSATCQARPGDPAFDNGVIFISKSDDTADSAANEIVVESQWAGKRLDAAAAVLFDGYSRNRLQLWINEGYLTVDGEKRRSRDKLLGGELLSLTVPAGLMADTLPDMEGSMEAFTPESIDFPIVFEDEQILVVNKPAGLVMHPAPGNRQGTLLNGLLHHLPELAAIPRAGIVHRLDKDTSGLCVVAKTLTAHTHLVRQLQERAMGRMYSAVAIGEVPINGTIDAPIGRHPRDRKRMAVTDHGKPAVTHYQYTERYVGCARVSLKLETGRTHQIRVHMAHIGHALLGDPVYGRRLAVLPRCVAEVPEVAAFNRQALHASRLTLVHPASNEEMSFDAQLPDDMHQLCAALLATARSQLRKEFSQ